MATLPLGLFVLQELQNNQLANSNILGPPRRDNKHVTDRRIAAKYEKFIMANLRWNFAQMKSTVLEEMFTDVSVSKLKRAKTIVMQKAYDATKGQYELLYDYQLELLRSNSGSTVVINSLPDVEPPMF